MAGYHRLFAFVTALLLCHYAYATPYGYTNCKNIASDHGWPNQEDWVRLNKTVEGRLIATVPIATYCHDPSYHQSQCQVLKDTWAFSDAQ